MTSRAEDIVVVGGGLTGLAFAIAARHQGYEVAVFDRRSEPQMPNDLSANVIALNVTSTSFLTDLGVFGQIPDIYRPAYLTMRVFDGTGVGTVAFDAADAGYPVLGNIVDQRALVYSLAAVAERAGVKICWQTAFDLEETLPSLLVAADGAHSNTREQLGFRKLRYDYHQTATVCLAELSASHEQCAWQWFHEDGPIALLPLADEHRVAVVWSSSRDRSTLETARFQQELTAATEGRLGEITASGDRFAFPLQQLQLLQYVAQGVALLGDAAHAIHPLAGQGANLGIADVITLATEVGSAKLEGRSPGDIALLKRYERERRPHNHLAGAAMEGFHRLFAARNPLIGWARNHGMRFVQGNSLVKQMAVNAASGRL